MHFSQYTHTFLAHIDAIVVYFIMLLTKYTECNILPTYHKYIVCKLTLVCPKYCDKRSISNLNKITCKDCHNREASIALAQLSDSVTLTEKSSSSESSESNEKGDIGLIMEAESLSRIITI